MTPLFIFDIDGTLANTKHRQHILERQDYPAKWRDFYLACDKDDPIPQTLRTMELLRVTGAEIWFFTGREEFVRDRTEKWLVQHTSFMSWDLKSILLMRPDSDHRPDYELKEHWYDNMLIEDQERLVAVFEDRTRVVEMWRRNNVMCYQVEEGKF